MAHPQPEIYLPTPAEKPAVPASFNYAELPSNAQCEVQASVQRIRELNQDLTIRIFQIGQELERVKALLGHGAFGPWLNAEFGWSERTAQRFLQAVEVFGSKADTVSVLEPTAIYELSAKSTPSSVRDAVVARLEAGERP